MHPLPPSPWIFPFFLVHAGCPHRCIFCDQNVIARTRSPVSPRAVGEILEALGRSQRPPGKRRRQVAFYGGSFTRMPAERQHAYLDACRPFVGRGVVDSIRVSTRPDEVSGGQLAFLAERGVETVELGIQSLSDRVLRASRRGHSCEEARDAVQRVRAMGLEAGAQLMVGLPGDTGKESLETAEQLAGLKPDFVRIYPLLVLRHTELAESLQSGAYEPLGLEEAVSLCTEMLRRFEEASIPVIRIGLQEQEELGRGGGDVLAGPYHPAFGHLVRSSLFLAKALALLPRSMPDAPAVRLRIHPHDRPLLVGDRRRNVVKIRKALGNREIRLEEDPGIPRGTVQWEGRGGREEAGEKALGSGTGSQALLPNPGR